MQDGLGHEKNFCVFFVTFLLLTYFWNLKHGATGQSKPPLAKGEGSAVSLGIREMPLIAAWQSIRGLGKMPDRFRATEPEG